MYIPLTDAALVLETGATKTATFNSAWLDLGIGWQPANLGVLLAGVVSVTAIDKTTGDETYVYKLQEADEGVDSNGFPTGQPDAATVRDAGLSFSATDLGTIVAKGVSTTRFIRLVMTAAGTTPSISYTANIGM